MAEVIFSTLGHGVDFHIDMDSSERSVTIRRVFRNGQEHNKAITFSDLEAIRAYMVQRNDWVCLANNVQKLAAGTETDGLGSFLYKELTGWGNTADAQLASHIAALFVHSEVFELQSPRKTKLRFRLKYPKMSTDEMVELLFAAYKKKRKEAILGKYK